MYQVLLSWLNNWRNLKRIESLSCLWEPGSSLFSNLFKPFLVEEQLTVDELDTEVEWYMVENLIFSENVFNTTFCFGCQFGGFSQLEIVFYGRFAGFVLVGSDFVRKIYICTMHCIVTKIWAFFCRYWENEKVRLDYRPVHMNTLDDEVESFPPKARVY